MASGSTKKALLLTVLAAAIFAAGALATTPAPVVGNVKNGKRLFKAHLCGTCHVMSAAGIYDSNGTAPSLDHTRKTYAQIVAKITLGNIKKGMNPYKGALTTKEIQDVSAFVYKSAHAS